MERATPSSPTGVPINERSVAFEDPDGAGADP